jgi:hypothetical protein
MSRDDFLSLRPDEFEYLYRHYQETDIQRREESYRMQWESARWQVFRTLCPPDKKQITVYDLIEFPWEKEEIEKQKSTEERFRQVVKKFNG